MPAVGIWKNGGLRVDAELRDLYDAMIDVYRKAKSEVRGYTPTWYLDMVVSEGPVVTAERLITSEVPASGYARLFEAGRLDLTVEALIVENERFHRFFAPEVVEAARARLKQYRYKE